MSRRNIPTVEELIKVCEDQGYESYHVSLLEEVVFMLNKFPKYFEYLESKGLDDYELSYFIFGDVADYMIELNEYKNFKELMQRIGYLEDRLFCGIEDIETLIHIEVFEGLYCTRKGKKLIAMMPKKIQKYCEESFSEFFK